MGPWSREGWTVAYGPNLACCLFLYSLWAKNDALILQLFLQKDYFVIVKLHEIQVLASGIKFCWNTAPFNSSPSVLWLCLLWPQTWVVVTQTVWPVLPKIFILWPFTEIVCCLLGCVAVVQLPSCVWLCNAMDCSMSGLPVLHHLLEFAQVHVHFIGDAIQLSHPLMSSSPYALNLSQHWGIFQ